MSNLSGSRNNPTFLLEVYDFLNLILNFPFHLKLNQRVLKNIFIILLLLCVSFTYAAAAATGGEEEKKKKHLQDQQDPNRQQSLLPKLDGEPESGGIEDIETEIETEADDEEVVAESDSTQSSFRKFNFIFYFLYKFKYENDARFGTIPQELESN